MKLTFSIFLKFIYLKSCIAARNGGEQAGIPDEVINTVYDPGMAGLTKAHHL